MKKAQRTQQPTAQVQGLITDGKVVVSKDGRYVTVYFADGSRIREHRNRFLSVLGEPFVAEPKKGARRIRYDANHWLHRPDAHDALQ